MIVRGLIPLAFLALCLAEPVSAQDDASQKVRQISAEYQAANRALGQEFQTAEDPETKQDILENRLPELLLEFAGKFQAAAEEYKGQTAGVEALSQISQLTGRLPVQINDEAKAELKAIGEKANKDLLDNYADNEALVPLIYTMGSNSEILDKLAESENRDVRGVAKFFQVQAAKGRELNESNAETIKPMMENLVEVYGDVHVLYGARDRGTISDLVENELFAFENLRIGKVAPEIKGSDIDDVAFKLSDYRGKVVVIDFWGDW